MSKSFKKSLAALVYLALTLIILLVFWQVRNFDFNNFDDFGYVFENDHVLSGLTWAGVIWAFTTNLMSNWHPLTWLSLMLDCQLFGPNPGRMHLINVLMHLANTLLLFAVLKKMTGSLWPSAFVAAAFAVHPMHVESVAWISERKDVLSAFFWMLTLFAYVRYVERPAIFRYLAALVIFAIGLLAKPMLVTLPFVLLLLDYWPLERRKVLHRLLIEKIPFFVLSAVSSVITFLVQLSGGAVVNTVNLPLKGRIVNAFWSYAVYLGKMFWPTKLAVFYPINAGSIQFWHVAFSVVLLLAVSIFVIRFGREKRYLLVGWFWFVGTLIPVIGFVQVGSQAYADRYTYIPYIGLFIMIAWGLPDLLSKWRYRRIALGISMLVVLTALGICTYIQTGYWKNSVTLFTHAVSVTRNNYLIYDSLAKDYDRKGDLALAHEYFTKALRAKPDYADALQGLGTVVGEQGNIDLAIDYFRQALQLNPNFAYAHANLGAALLKQGKLSDALAHLGKAVQLKPDFAEARKTLAVLLYRQGKIAQACQQYRQVLKIKPDWTEPMNDLAWILAASPDPNIRNPSEAIALAKKACAQTDYKEANLLDTLAAAYASADKFTDAVDTAKKALTLADTPAQSQYKDSIQNHLTLFEQGKPCIEPPPALPADSNKP